MSLSYKLIDIHLLSVKTKKNILKFIYLGIIYLDHELWLDGVT